MRLPVHGPLPKPNLKGAILQVDGLVAECLQLTAATLQRLPQQGFTNDFTCLEGWTVPDIKWGGVLLEAVLALAKPTAKARYVQVSAGEFSVTLAIDVLEGF